MSVEINPDVPAVDQEALPPEELEHPVVPEEDSAQ